MTTRDNIIYTILQHIDYSRTLIDFGTLTH